ncbi:MAG: Crp/Fnr family transcriptional regulator [Pseudomonadota bacterium]
MEHFVQAVAERFDLISFSYAVTLLAYTVRDMLPLRALLAVAALTMLGFGWQTGMTAMVVWNSLFVVVNLVQLVLVIRERRPVRFDSDEARRAWETVFWAMTPREFMRLWGRGERVRLNAGTLCSQGQIPAHLAMVLSGTVSVEQSGRSVARVGAFQLVGEMGFITNSPATADAVVREPVELLQWRRADLARLARRHPELVRKLDSAIGQDLVRKLTSGTAGPDECGVVAA